MIRTIRSFTRLFVIARSLARYDALFLLNVHPAGAIAARVGRTLFRRRPESAGLRPGQRLARALTELGPTFIKFGQALSTRADLLGEEVTADLAELQDRLPPFPAKAARAMIEADFGVPLSALYSSFDDTPVAAASIAQVHFAVTADGREVAVKVLRPDVKEKFAKDFEVMFWMAEEVERWAPRLRPCTHRHKHANPLLCPAPASGPAARSRARSVFFPGRPPVRSMASPVYSLLPDHTQPAIKPSPPPHTHTNGPQDYFSIVAFFIFLRETLEAAVIIAVRAAADGGC